MPEKVVNLIIELYEKTKAPTILFDENLEYIWSNQSASEKYPFLKTHSGVSLFITELDKKKILSNLSAANGQNKKNENSGARWSYNLPVTTHFTPSSSLNFTLFSARKDTYFFVCTISIDSSNMVEANSEDLFSMVSYHIREPLFYIFSAIDALEILVNDNDENNEKKESSLTYINTISDNSYHILRVITMINKYLKMINGLPNDDTKEIFHLNKFIESLAYAVHVTTATGDIAFYYQISDENMIVNADPDEVSSIVFHLIYNAFIYTRDENKVSLTLKKEGEFAVIKIIDKGVGISEKRLKDIFSPFNSLNIPLQNSNGLGLGLSISLLSAITMGGDITITSKVGTGTVAEFRLPLSSSLKTKVITLKQGDVSFISNKFSKLYMGLPGIAKKPLGG